MISQGKKVTPLARASTSSAKRSADWDADLPFGLPRGFDFRFIKTVSDVGRLISTLPNRDRGRAAKQIYDKRSVVGKEIVYPAIMRAWEQDHRMVRAASARRILNDGVAT
jgi:hypothetical protein